MMKRMSIDDEDEANDVLEEAGRIGKRVLQFSDDVRINDAKIREDEKVDEELHG